MLKKENKDLLEFEKSITSRIYKCIDEKQNFIFNAGAGAGKTYALIECLKYVCKEKEALLKYHNQKIVCITYTNVAANEIKERLGNTDIILVSTIHERLWDLIKRYQEELVEIHLENIEAEIGKILETPYDTTWISTMSDNQRQLFAQTLFDNKEEFYKLINLKANEFRTNIETVLSGQLLGPISSVDKFKKDCKNIIKLVQYERCVLAIREHLPRFTEVIYDSRRNRDSLHNMRISHDTLLLYALKIYSKFEKLRRLTTDRFPYFFIDEYQDTNPQVIEIVKLITSHGAKIKHPVLVGYFGDSAQNIYDMGIGENVKKYTCNYEEIDKPINRRSCYEIIDVANRVRGGDLLQESLYDDACGGSVKVFYGDESQTDNFIQTSANEILQNSDQSGKVHCFLLLNQSVAEHVGIGALFDWFKSTSYYSHLYTALNTELLSNDIDKLGIVERCLYNIVELVDNLDNRETRLTDVFSMSILNSLNISLIRKMVDAFKIVGGENLGDVLTSIETLKDRLYSVLEEKKSKDSIDAEFDRIIGADDFTAESFSRFIREYLFEGDEDAESRIDDLLHMDFAIFRKWFKYVKRDYSDKIIYHTFHSTKGLEFDNVIIVFGDKFGRNNTFFSDYFSSYEINHSDFSGAEYVKARNLLYVAVTRAKKNLRILYTGDYGKNRDALMSIFGGINRWGGGS